MSRAAVLSLTLLLGGGAALEAQEDLWDPSFNLSAGLTSGADTAALGQNKAYGLSLAGAYPLTRNHLVVFEGGYRALPTATVRAAAGLDLDSKTDGYFGGAAYRFRFTRGALDGLYLQGGLRCSSTCTTQDTILRGAAADGGDLRTSRKSPRVFSVRPTAGVGFRFTERLSLELDLAGFQAQNVAGESKSATVVELVVGVHL